MLTPLCTICGNDGLLCLFERADSSQKPVEVRLCLRCFVIVPAYSTERTPDDHLIERQAEFHAAVWPELTPEQATNLREEVRPIVDYYHDKLGDPAKAGLVLDIGAGRGALIAALRAAGYDAGGCEPSSDLCERARRAYNLPADRLLELPAEEFLDHLAHTGIEIGHFFLWHVIEHVANPLKLVRRVAELLPAGHYAFLQAPCLDQDYLFPEHLILFTEPAVHAIARNSGCEVADITYDHSRTYISFVLRRTCDALPQAWRDATPVSDQMATLAVEVGRATKKIARLEHDLAAAQALAVERMSALDRQSKMIDDRDRWISELQLLAGRRQQTLGELDTALREKESAVSDHVRLIDDLREMLHRHERRIVAQDEMLQRSATHMMRKLLRRVLPGREQ